MSQVSFTEHASIPQAIDDLYIHSNPTKCRSTLTEQLLIRKLTATTSSMNLKQQNFDSDEGLEMSDLSPPCTPKAKAKAKPLCQMPREVNFVGGQLHEYDGFWSPDVVEQRKEERRAERERRRFRKMQTKKDRTQNMIGAVRRAEGLDGTRDVVGTDLFVIGEEDEEGEEA